MGTTDNPIPAPADEHADDAVRNASTVIELLGILTLGITLVLDAISRLVNEDQATLSQLATGFAVVAALCAIVDALATVAAYRRHPHAFRVHLVADLVAAALILLSVALRATDWNADDGTSIWATVPAALAFILIGVATWTNITERSTAARAGARRT